MVILPFYSNMATLRLSKKQAFLLVSGFMLCCSAEKVEFFKNIDFKGEKLIAYTSANCTNLPSGFKSMKNRGCVAIFSESDCPSSGFGIAVEEENQVPFFSFTGERLQKQQVDVKSVRSCQNFEGWSNINFDYHLDYYIYVARDGSKTPHYRVVKFRDVHTCQNLPRSRSNPNQQVRAYGNCMQFYKAENCVGVPYVITNYILNSLNAIYLSAKPCPPPAPSAILKSTVIFLEPIPDGSNLFGSIKEVTIASNQKYINNGTATMQQLYAAEKEVTETAEFEFSQSLRQMKSVTFTTGLATTIGATIPGFTASESLSAEIAKNSQTESSSGNRTSFSVATKKLFRVEKTIIVPQCTAYQVYSVVEMAENIELLYRIQVKITGVSQSGKSLTSAEMLGFLKNESNDLSILDKHSEADEYSLVAETTATLKVNFGINSIVDGTGDPIPDCIRRHDLCTEKPNSNSNGIQNMSPDEKSGAARFYLRNICLLILTTYSMIC